MPKGKEAHETWMEKDSEKEKEPKPPKPIAEETANPDNDQIAAHLAYQAAYGPFTPETYAKAIRSPQADEWIMAMQEELDMLVTVESGSRA
jgi:hypothetical protein